MHSVLSGWVELAHFWFPGLTQVHEILVILPQDWFKALPTASFVRTGFETWMELRVQVSGLVKL